MITALCRFKGVTKREDSNARTLTEVQNHFTTKDTKHTWGV